MSVGYDLSPVRDVSNIQDKHQLVNGGYETGTVERRGRPFLVKRKEFEDGRFSESGIGTSYWRNMITIICDNSIGPDLESSSGSPET
jgi:hypothetical protein